MASRIEYSEKYQDDSFEYRYAIADVACMASPLLAAPWSAVREFNLLPHA
jgi:Cyclin-dependent kinase regulatory subunit